MKNLLSLFAPLLFCAVTLAGCAIIGDIFKAGVWVGVILVLAIIGIVVWMVSKSGT
jgi:uncharacterized membrane protein YkvI